MHTTRCASSVPQPRPVLHPCELQPVKPLCPWNFPGKNIGVGLLPFPTTGHLPDPGIKPASPASPALAGRFFTTEPPGKPGCHQRPRQNTCSESG